MYRQLYAAGGISSLSQAKNLLQKHAPEGEHLAYINPQEAALLKRHGGSGIMTAAGIPSFGILKTIRNIIPNEIGQIASAAAPFVAAANPMAGAALAAFGSFDRTGKLGDVVKSAAINYGLGQLSRGIGGAGFQSPEQGISSFGNLFQGTTEGFLTSPIGTESGLKLGQYDFFKTPTQLQADQAQKSLFNQMEPFGGEVDYGTLSAPTNQGYLDIGKKIVSPNTTLTDKFDAIKDLGGKALKDIYTTPVRDASGKVVDYNIDKTALISTISGVSSYIDAKKKADEAGLTDDEFNEEIYQQNKVSPYKTTFSQRLQPSSFGITTAKDGGRIGFDSGGMSNSRVTQLLQLLEEAQMKGDQDKVDIIRAELNTMKKADGGRIGFEDGKLVLPKDTEGPGNKQIRLQMEKAAKKAQEEYIQRKIQEELMDRNYKEQSMYDWKKDQKELFDRAPEEGYPSLPEPKKPEGVLSIKLTEKKAKGGRITKRKNYLFGNIVKASGVAEPVSSDMPIPSGLVNLTGGGFGNLIKQLINQNPDMFAGKKRQLTDKPVNDLYQYYLNNENDAEIKNQILEANKLRFNRADGGVMDVAPMRMLKGGIPEMDLRAKGGYVPYGKKERADDVPAMLSKNEFVFTAKAVRNAGNGSINKGAQKMYKLMKSLENKSVRR